MALDINRPLSLVKTLHLFHKEEWLTWTPDTVQLVLERQFGYTPDELDLNKVEALREALRSDRFLTNALLFEKLVRSFCGIPFTDKLWEPVSAAELAFGVHVLGQIAGPEKLGGASESVLAYMAACLEDDGIVYGPASLGLDTAQEEIEGASQAELGVVDDCEALWPAVEKAFFSEPTADAFLRASKRVVQRYVATGDTGKATSAITQERRFVAARSLVALAGVLLALQARSASPKAPIAVSAARERRLALRAAL